ncbi:subtilase family protein [Sarocladium implicatum]|nr:subtilase family protein [Sarocladium implicatum]
MSNKPTSSTQPVAAQPESKAVNFPNKMGHYLVQMEPGEHFAFQREELARKVCEACRKSSGPTKSVVIREWNDARLKLYTFEGFFNEEIMNIINSSRAKKAVDSAQDYQVCEFMDKKLSTTTTTTVVDGQDGPTARKAESWFQSFISPSDKGSGYWKCPEKGGEGVTIYVAESKPFWLQPDPTYGRDKEFEGRIVRKLDETAQKVNNEHGIIVSQSAAGKTRGMAPNATVVTACPTQEYIDKVLKEYTNFFGQINYDRAMAFGMHEILQKVWDDWVRRHPNGGNAFDSVLNCSWGVKAGELKKMEVLRNTLEQVAPFMLIVAAAGNKQENLNKSKHLPASLDSVLTVGGLNESGGLWKDDGGLGQVDHGSATGDAVDVFAPATNAVFVGVDGVWSGTSFGQVRSDVWRGRMLPR